MLAASIGSLDMVYMVECLISMSSGRIRFKKIETTNTTATALAEKTDWAIFGKRCHISVSLAVVKPMTIGSDRAAIVIFLWVKSAFGSISVSEVRMVPNIIMVHPPRTTSEERSIRLKK